jgi:Domain of unknown function (DUF4149)
MSLPPALSSRLMVMVACVWWGSLTTIGFLVVPLLFAHLPTPAMAGLMAAKLFSAQTWVGCACAVLLLLWYKQKQHPAPVLYASPAIIFIATGLLLALLLEFGVAPKIVARENVRLWHTAGSLMYFLQWLCAGAVLWKATAPEHSAQV